MFILENSQYKALKGKWNHEYFAMGPVFVDIQDYKVVHMRHGKLETAKVLEVQPTKLIVSTEKDGIKIINRHDCVPYSHTIFHNGKKQEQLIVDSLVYEYL